MSVQLFLAPQKYRNDILAKLRFPQDDYVGESYVAISPTKFCPVGCAHCYFASPKPTEAADGALHDDDIPLVSRFVDDANTGFLQITGGGEPLLELDNVIRLIRATQSIRVDLNTSGVFCTTPLRTKEIFDQLFDAFTASRSRGKFITRLSIDDFHIEKIKDKSIRNVIALYRREYSRYNAGHFYLKLHSIIGDDSIPRMLASMKDEVANLEYEHVFGNLLPTGVTFNEGTRFDIDYSLRMLANTMPDLHDSDAVAAAIEAYDRLRIPSPGLFVDRYGRKGLCFVIHEDASVELWNTTPNDNVPSIRTHNLQAIKNIVFSDVIQVASLRHDALYVESILDEVNPLAVRRAKTIGSATLFNRRALCEARDRLYVSLRLIQEFLIDSTIDDAQVRSLSPVVQEAITFPRKHLQELYRQCSYDFVEQQLLDPSMDVRQLMLLHQTLTLGHYTTKPEDLLQRVSRSKELDEDVRRAFLEIMEPSGASVTKDLGSLGGIRIVGA